ncbi:MAG: hypothetical protein IJZ70_04940 [Bacteroidales bacterium]|nr:hypothetical protein [Bacteroidales bacterium]
MKKLFKSLFVIIAAMVTFAGCMKEDVNTPASETKTVQFFAESIETKTAFGTPDGTTYPTLWTANDEKVQLLLNLNEKFTADVNVADDFISASFSTEVTVDGSVSPYQFCAISPSIAYLGNNNERFSVTIPTSQTPLENSVDEAAQILYALSDSYDEIPETVDLDFKHFTAYGNLSFTDLDLGEANVTSIAITSSVNFANRWNCFVADESFGVNSGASTITLNTSATENLWFACAPVGDMNGNTLTFTINTDKGPLSKTVTLGEKHKFESGRIAKMTVSMEGIEFEKSKVYELVTDASELTSDSEIIIVASGYNFALSTTQNSNNRAQAAVTKSEDKSTIKDPGNDVQVLIVGEGASEETISLSTGEKYLYAPGGGNYLRETTTLNENASWFITVADTGVATIKADRTDRNWMRYNSSNNPPIFSCYTSGQTDVSIYKLQGTGSAPLPKLTAPVVTAVLNDDETGINVSWQAVENATSYVISGIGDDVETTETSYSFTELASGTYTVSVKAVADGYRSATGTATAVTVPSAGDDEVGESVTETLTIKATTGVLASDSKSISWTGTNFTCVNEQASSSNAIRTSDPDHFRVYAKSVLKFTATGKTFTKVVVTCTNTSYATVLQTSATNAGYTATVSGSDVTITSASAVSEISMTASEQTRINKVEATLQ